MVYSKKNYKNKKIDSIVEELNNKIEDFRNNDETYKAFLDTSSKFHNYSINNIMLIASQNPEATHVAGYKAWKNKFDRQVQKGAKSINIIAPVIKKKNVDVLDENGKVERDYNGNPKQEKRPQVAGYRVHHVFDVSDTKGKPLITASDLIKTEFENSNDYKDLYNEFKDYINDELSTSVEEKHVLDDVELKNGAKGYYVGKSDEIVISDDLSYDMRFKTLIHEYAHSQLHSLQGIKPEEDKKLRALREIEAESSSYIISKYYGLDTSDFSLGYLSGWGSSMSDEEIKNHIKNIHSFAKDTIEEINDLPEFSRFIDQKLETEMTKEFQNKLETMIDTNLKNGFDKVSIIQSNLTDKFGLDKIDDKSFENEDFKIIVDYQGYDTKHQSDDCKVDIINKHDESKNRNFDFTQTYNRNVINNTSTIFVNDNNTDDEKKYIHSRDIDGNLNEQKNELDPADEIVSFEAFINDSVEKNGLSETLRQFVSNGVLMDYKLNTDHINHTNETYISMNKNDKNGDYSLMSAKLEFDNNDNIHVDFKIKNSAGIKNMSFSEDSKTFDSNLHSEHTSEKTTENDKTEELDI